MFWLELCCSYHAELMHGLYFYRLHWLPVEQRIVYKTALITYKVRAQSTPEYLLTLLQNRECTRTLRSSSLPLLDIPRFRTVTASRSFRVAAPVIWNSLPRDVLACSTVDSFKKHLKTYLFNVAFTECEAVH